MAGYYTTGQAAKKLRISVSTLKRWLSSPDLHIVDRRNQNSWRLFSEDDLRCLREYKRDMRRGGRKYNASTLVPIVTKRPDSPELGQFGISVG